MTTLNEIAGQVDVCWRFADAGAPDHKPTNNHNGTNPGPDAGWDGWEVEDMTRPSSYLKTHGHRNVVLLKHYSVDPSGSPLEEFEAVPCDQVRSGQKYWGSWNEQSAKAVASRLNKNAVLTSSYREWRGPSDHQGWAVVRTVPEKVLETPAHVVLSSIDPFKDLTDAIFVLEIRTVDGIKGLECLARFERGQQTESIARNGDSYVCTNAECGLNNKQIEHARDLWAAKLKLRAAQAKAAEATRVAQDRMQVVCDNIDELPNMTYVDG